MERKFGEEIYKIRLPKEKKKINRVSTEEVRLNFAENMYKARHSSF